MDKDCEKKVLALNFAMAMHQGKSSPEKILKTANKIYKFLDNSVRICSNINIKNNVIEIKPVK